MHSFRLTRPTLSPITWLMLFSFYTAVFLNIAYYQHVLAVMPLTSTHTVLVFLSMPIVAFSVINLVTTLASFIGLEKWVMAILILMSAAAQFFMRNYGIMIDRTMIANMLDTTTAETFALLTPQFLIAMFFSGILAVLVGFWLRQRKYHSLLKAVSWRLGNIAVSVLLIMLVALLFYKDYASLFRNNRELIKTLNPSNTISAMLSYYRHHKLANLPLVRIGEDARLDPIRASGPRKNLTILIVGETSRADNFSLSGYKRQTNPLLAQDADVFYFPHTQSCGTSTAVSVPCMFSNMPRLRYDETLASHQEGMLDIIQRAGTHVLAAVKARVIGCLIRI